MARTELERRVRRFEWAGGVIAIIVSFVLIPFLHVDLFIAIALGVLLGSVGAALGFVSFLVVTRRRTVRAQKVPKIVARKVPKAK